MAATVATAIDGADDFGDGVRENCPKCNAKN
jgi:hypothetical protein